MDVLIAIVGLVILTLGADVLVDGATGLARRFGVSPIVVGLTIVAFGTSAPEMAVSVVGARTGLADVAVGNVVGSNIFNVLLILGLAAVVAPLVVHRRLIQVDVPLMIAASGLTWIFARDGVFSTLEGAALFLGILAYTGHALRQALREQGGPEADDDASMTGLAAGARIAGGLALLVLGSRWFVDGSVSVAHGLGVDDRIIGLTLIAAGTSLPELATSVVAAWRGQRDIAVGNVVGSNIFNLLAVLGLSAMIAPAGLPVSAGALTLDLPVMVAVAAVCLPFFFTGHKVSRLEGTIFLVSYLAYTAWLVLDVLDHAHAGALAQASALVLAPAVAVAFAHGLWEHQVSALEAR